MKFLSFREVVELSENQFNILRYCLERVLPEDVAGVEIDSISIHKDRNIVYYSYEDSKNKLRRSSLECVGRVVSDVMEDVDFLDGEEILPMRPHWMNC